MITIYFDADGCIMDYVDDYNNVSSELTEREKSRIKDVYAFYENYYKPQQLVYSKRYFESFQYLQSITLERAALSADNIWLEELVAGYVYNINIIQAIIAPDLKAVTSELKVQPDTVC